MVKVRDKSGKVFETNEVIFQKQGANMGWTLIETDIVETPTVTPTDETLKFIESQKAALEAPVVETVVPDETAALKAEIERLIKENIRLKAELAKKECKSECKEPEIPEFNKGGAVTEHIEGETGKESVVRSQAVSPKKQPVKRKPRTKKTTK